ncbi:MAG: DUF6020 family protein [Anaerostipes sp.]|nr:DUF6020 family protein [Anaerostipes sp.]
MNQVYTKHRTLYTFMIVVTTLISVYATLYEVKGAKWTTLLLYGAVGYLLYQTYRKTYEKRMWIICGGVGLFLAIWQVLGRSYKLKNSWILVLGSKSHFLKSIELCYGYMAIFTAVLLLLYMVAIPKMKAIKGRELPVLTCNKKTIFFVMAVLLLAWIPYIKTAYPATLSNDSVDQLMQIMGNAAYSRTFDNTIPINPSVVLNNHHPALYTMFIGIFVKFGENVLGSIPFGVFLHMITQCIIMAGIFAFSIWYMAKEKISIYFRGLALVFFATFPVVPEYCVTITKDTLYSGFILLFTIAVYDLIKHPENIMKSRGKQIGLRVLLFLIFAIQNKGMYIAIPILILLLIVLKEYRKKLVIMFMVPVLFFSIVITKILFPALEITPGSKREMLSVPIQQTARYCHYYANDLSKKEEKALVNMFGITPKNIGKLYNVDFSDPVKNRVKPDLQTSDIKEYLGSWISMGLKHPGTYIEATLNSNYTLFYFDTKRKIYYHGIGYENPYVKLSHISQKKVNLQFEDMKKLKKRSYVSCLFSVGFYVWLLGISFFYYISKKKGKESIPYCINLLNVALVILGPVVYMRYALPIVVCAPFYIGSIARESQIEVAK